MSSRHPPGNRGRHRPLRWDRGDIRLYGPSERVLSPAQRGEVTESGPIPPEIDWSELRAYVCYSCKDHCLNWIGSACTQANECRSCHQVRQALLPPTTASEGEAARRGACVARGAIAPECPERATVHDYHSHNEDDRPISMKRIDPNADDVESIANLGSYIGEYIDAYGEALFDRDLDELIFRAATWATGTQIVRFSKGANEVIERDWGGPRPQELETRVRPNPAFDPEIHRKRGSGEFPFEVENPGWSIVGVARRYGDNEQVLELHRSNVVWREIDDASQLDPPKTLASDRPRRSTRRSDLTEY